MDSCLKPCALKLRAIVPPLLGGICCAINLFFFCVLTVLCVMIIVDIVIGLQFQAALPPSIGAAFACVALAGVAFPWLGAVLATTVDWQRWPVRYSRMRNAVSEILGIDPPSNAAEHSQNIRRVCWYFVPLALWVLCTIIGVQAGVDKNIGTVIFIVCSFAYAVINSVADIVGAQFRRPEDSAMLFILFGANRGTFPIVAISFELCTLISVLVQDKSMIIGGDGAIAASFVTSVLFLFFHAGVFWSESKSSDHSKKVFDPRSRRTLTLALVEITSVLVAAILIAVSFSGSDSAGVWVFLIFVVATYALIYYQNEKVDLDDKTPVAKNMSATGDGDGDSAFGKSPRGEGQQMKSASQLHHHHSAVEAEYRRSAMSSDPDVRNAAAMRPSAASSVAVPASEPNFSGDINKSSSSSPPASSASAANARNKAMGHDHDHDDEDADEKAAPLVVRCSDAQLFDDTLMDAHGNRSFEATVVHSQLDRDALVGQRTVVQRIANVLVGLACAAVLLASMINTGSNNRAVSCPGIYPGANSTSASIDDRFTICDVAFDGGFAITDFSALAAASYFTDANFDAALPIYFPGQNATKVGGDNAASAFIGVRYFTVRFPLQNVTAVITRGSFRSIDWLQDVYLTSDAFCLQLGMQALPVFFSDNMQATLVDIISSLKFGMRSYTTPVRHEVERVKRVYPGDFVYVVGHSLGGLASNIVGAQTTTKTVTFSPVGLALQMKRFNFEWKTANEVITAVVPMHDIVPKVDIQLGNVQNIVSIEPCGTKNAICHSMTLTQRSLATICGDPLGRVAIKHNAPSPCA